MFLRIMDEYVVYILRSTSYGKTYVGFTSDLISRFNSHNKFATKGYTIRYRPWEVIHVSFFATKKDAMEYEKQLKTGKGRGFIKTLLSN